MFDSDDKYDEEEELGVRQQEDKIVIEAVEEEDEEILEYDVVLRLGVMEQELLQEQDKTKSEVLGNSNIDKLMNDVVGEKPIGIFDQMATQWEHKLDKVTKDAITISRQADIVMQMKTSRVYVSRQQQ